MTTRVWNNQEPNSTDFVFDGDNAIQRWKEDLQERMEVDHIFGESVTDGSGQDGAHTKLTINNIDETLVFPVDEAYILLFVNGIFSYKDKDNNVVQITDGTIMRNSAGRTLSLDNAMDFFVGNRTFFEWWVLGGNLSVYTKDVPLSRIYSSGIDYDGLNLTIRNSGKYVIKFSVSNGSSGVTYPYNNDSSQLEYQGLFIDTYDGSHAISINYIIKVNSTQHVHSKISSNAIVVENGRATESHITEIWDCEEGDIITPRIQFNDIANIYNVRAITFISMSVQRIQ